MSDRKGANIMDNVRQDQNAASEGTGVIPRSTSSGHNFSHLDKIRTAWCHYNALNAELEYSLSEGGETDVTQDQVNHAWEDLNRLIMPHSSIGDKPHPIADAPIKEGGGE